MYPSIDFVSCPSKMTIPALFLWPDFFTIGNQSSVTSANRIMIIGNAGQRQGNNLTWLRAVLTFSTEVLKLNNRTQKTI